MRLSIFVFLAVIFIACNSTGSDPGDEIIRIGTWDVNITQLEADWIGSRSIKKAKTMTMQTDGDSVFFDTPDGVSLRLVHLRGFNNVPNEYFGLFFVDSTHTYSEYKEVILDSTYAEVYGAYGLGETDEDYLSLAFTGTYSCTNDTVNFDFLNFAITTDSDTTVYSFDVAGMGESLERIVCIYD